LIDRRLKKRRKDMKKMQAVAGVVISIFLCAGVWAATPYLNNFSADVVSTSHGETHTSKVYSKDGKSRMEANAGGREMISISRPDKRVVWMLMPASRTYMEMPYNMQRKDLSSQLNDPNVKPEKKFIGDETVDGHPTKKYHVTVIMNGDREASGYIWEATDMNNFPIKHQSEDGEITTVWKNIKFGGVSDSVFEIPAGYRKMSMPGMGGGMMPEGNMR
jgi:hypothetical protein